ncbi:MULTISPECIES: hypothetical protein [Calothrix]|nr:MULTISPECIES: hypothetical protein [Calothrix]
MTGNKNGVLGARRERGQGGQGRQGEMTIHPERSRSVSPWEKRS